MKEHIQEYVWITCGGFIQGIAMAVFLFPHSIPSGGAAGIAVLLNYWFNMPLSFSLWLVNFSLLVVAIVKLGNASAVGTMYAITITSISVHIFSPEIFIHNYHLGWDLLFGAILLGIGIGILLRQDVSNGGMGVLALVIAKHFRIPPGKPLFFLNSSIFILTASIINWFIVIQALITQTVSTRIVDIIYKLKLQFISQPLLGWRKNK